jgi:flagellum-specific peptidoglycan hydrolase FlgJ
MNTQVTTRVKHLFRNNMFIANEILQKNWLKLVIILVIAFIIVRKDLNISLNLINSPTQEQQPNVMPAAIGGGAIEPKSEKMSYTQTYNEDAPTSNQMKTNVSTQSTPTEPDNLANTFSNIGFILNPTYAKRNNVNPTIVAEKREICEAYIDAYSSYAVEEMKKYGIPASITLAQGLLESNAGASKLATLNKNHFGIKCFAGNCKPGHCSNYTDDSHKDFFRKYTDVKESYRAHSLFLQRSRYAHLSNLGTKDYKGWAHGLRKAGYATDKKYAPKLITLIETLKLHKYDKR